MSACLTGQVWSLELPRAELLVMLAFADHAKDDGSHVYPSIGHTAWKTGLNPRTVQRTVRSLERKGLALLVAEASRRRPREYRLDLSAGKTKPPWRYEDEGRHTAAPKTGGAAGSPGRGGSQHVSGVAPGPPETSIGNVRGNGGAGAREPALSHPDLDTVLEILGTCPRFDVGPPGVRVGVASALALHPDASPIEAARTAVVWASDPDWRKPSPGATLLDALAHQKASKSKAAGGGHRPRTRTEEQDANVVGLLERAAKLRAAGR